VSATDHVQLVELLDQLAGSIIYSREHLLEPPYEVQPGDRLADIARTYQIPTELLAKINGIQNAEQLYPGEILKVVRGPFKAVVNLDKQELTLMLDDGQGGVGRYAGRFPIDVAGGTMVSEGSFFVQSKVDNPHWINLSHGLGIHGGGGAARSANATPQSGIRLTQQDVNDVYDMLSTGSKVIIRR
jgi:LysM repeat protein